MNTKRNAMARMWMVRGEGGSLYDAFRERGVAAVGWNQLAAHAKPGVGRKQLITLYQSAEPQAKQGTVVSGASQVWRFVNDIQSGDWIITYSASQLSVFNWQGHWPSRTSPGVGRARYAAGAQGAVANAGNLTARQLGHQYKKQPGFHLDPVRGAVRRGSRSACSTEG